MGMGAGPRKGKHLSEINVTPFVDVMLVLLIIFMVAAPMLEQGIDLNLPDVRAAALERSSERIQLSIDARGQVHVDGTRIPPQRLNAGLAAIVKNRPAEPVFVQADETVQYGRVAEVLGILRTAGARKLHLVTEEPQTP